MSSPPSQATNIEDQECFMRTAKAFREYTATATKYIEKRREDWNSNITPACRQILARVFQDKSKDNDAADNNDEDDDDDGEMKIYPPQEIFDRQLQCVAENQTLLTGIADCAEKDLFDDYFPHPGRMQWMIETDGGENVDASTRPMPQVPRPAKFGPPTALDADKVHSTLRQVVRDWSSEGAGERAHIFDFFFTVLDSVFPFPEPLNRPATTRDGLHDRSNVQILVPGAGLSRLSVELAARGFSARGNEFSYHMLMAGHYIMNRVFKHNSHVIYPFSDITVNNWNRADMMRPVAFPDASAVEMFEEAETVLKMRHGDLSMVAGDFIEVFGKEEEKGRWHAVASCFFLDTAHNVIEYLKVIHDCLVDGGVLLNAGPLLFHWADNVGEVSIELAFDEFMRLLPIMGFQIMEGCKQQINAAYTSNARSMKQSHYNIPMFACRKVKPGFTPEGPIISARDEMGMLLQHNNEQQQQQQKRPTKRGGKSRRSGGGAASENSAAVEVVGEDEASQPVPPAAQQQPAKRPSPNKRQQSPPLQPQPAPGVAPTPVAASAPAPAPTPAQQQDSKTPPRAPGNPWGAKKQPAAPTTAAVATDAAASGAAPVPAKKDDVGNFPSLGGGGGNFPSLGGGDDGGGATGGKKRRK